MCALPLEHRPEPLGQRDDEPRPRSRRSPRPRAPRVRQDDVALHELREQQAVRSRTFTAATHVSSAPAASGPQVVAIAPPRVDDRRRRRSRVRGRRGRGRNRSSTTSRWRRSRRRLVRRRPHDDHDRSSALPAGSQRLPAREPRVLIVVPGDLVLAQTPAQEDGPTVDSPGKSTKPVSGSRRRIPRSARYVTSARSVRCASNQSLPATPPPSTATASVIRSLVLITCGARRAGAAVARAARPARRSPPRGVNRRSASAIRSPRRGSPGP